MKNFRELYASEIEVRAAKVNANGVSLLLYKDARCDMKILDETVGPFGWQRHHSRDNANCVVSIWDEDKKQWIEKEDTGAESYTEKEKGLCSDSFKRACFNWGIGRSLYTAPFIYVKDVDIEQKNGKYVLAPSVRFYVDTYEVTEGVITKLVIVDNKNRTVFEWPKSYDRKPVLPSSYKKEKVEAPVEKSPEKVAPKVDYSYCSTGTADPDRPTRNGKIYKNYSEKDEIHFTTPNDDDYCIEMPDLFDDNGNAIMYDDEGHTVPTEHLPFSDGVYEDPLTGKPAEKPQEAPQEAEVDLSKRYRISSAYFGEGAKGAYVKIYYRPCAGGDDLYQLQSLGNKYGVAAFIQSIKGLEVIPEAELQKATVDNLEPIKTVINELAKTRGKFEFNLECHKNQKGYDVFSASI